MYFDRLEKRKVLTCWEFKDRLESKKFLVCWFGIQGQVESRESSPAGNTGTGWNLGKFSPAEIPVRG
jgi:hypothetical protein